MKDPDLQPTIRTIFSDLVQQVETAPVAGSVYSRERDSISYLYAKVPVGSQRVDRFLGKVGDAQAEAEAASLRLGGELARKRRDIVSLLKRDRLAGPDRTLGAMLDAIAYAGLFRAGAVLVGTAAYMMFEYDVRAARRPQASCTHLDDGRSRPGHRKAGPYGGATGGNREHIEACRSDLYFDPAARSPPALISLSQCRKLSRGSADADQEQG